MEQNILGLSQVEASSCDKASFAVEDAVVAGGGCVLVFSGLDQFGISKPTAERIFEQYSFNSAHLGIEDSAATSPRTFSLYCDGFQNIKEVSGVEEHFLRHFKDQLIVGFGHDGDIISSVRAVESFDGLKVAMQSICKDLNVFPVTIFSGVDRLGLEFVPQFEQILRSLIVDLSSVVVILTQGKIHFKDFEIRRRYSGPQMMSSFGLDTLARLDETTVFDYARALFELIPEENRGVYSLALCHLSSFREGFSSDDAMRTFQGRGFENIQIGEVISVLRGIMDIGAFNFIILDDVTHLYRVNENIRDLLFMYTYLQGLKSQY